MKNWPTMARSMIPVSGARLIIALGLLVGQNMPALAAGPAEVVGSAGSASPVLSRWGPTLERALASGGISMARLAQFLPPANRGSDLKAVFTDPVVLENVAKNLDALYHPSAFEAKPTEALVDALTTDIQWKRARSAALKRRVRSSEASWQEMEGHSKTLDEISGHYRAFFTEQEIGEIDKTAKIARYHYKEGFFRALARGQAALEGGSYDPFDPTEIVLAKKRIEWGLTPEDVRMDVDLPESETVTLPILSLHRSLAGRENALKEAVRTPAPRIKTAAIMSLSESLGEAMNQWELLERRYPGLRRSVSQGIWSSAWRRVRNLLRRFTKSDPYQKQPVVGGIPRLSYRLPDRLLPYFRRAETAARRANHDLDQIADTDDDYREFQRLRASALASFHDAFIALQEALRLSLSSDRDPAAEDMARLRMMQVRFEMAKILELHDETTRRESLSAAAKVLEDIENKLMLVTPRHPDLLKGYEELRAKVAEERRRAAEALAR